VSSVRIADNPFYVLGLSPDASRIEVERQAQLLLGMLELAFADAATYATPLGPRPRTAEAVRAAVATLRDPHQRLVAELWVRNAPRATTTSATSATPAPDEAPPIALTRERLGWP
jgi:hypothetical protein